MDTPNIRIRMHDVISTNFNILMTRKFTMLGKENWRDMLMTEIEQKEKILITN